MQLERMAGRMLPPEFEVGGLIGTAELVDCRRTCRSKWKERGRWDWVLANARPLPFRSCKGAVGFFYMNGR